MKKMQIFEPAMCCSTGLCGVGVDPELLRISTVLNTLEKNGMHVDRFNLTNAPQEFVTNKTVNTYINESGVEGLPVIVVDDEIVITGRYPSNDEFVKLLNVPKSYVGEKRSPVKATFNKKHGCGCSGSDGCC
ncbi:arsenite efflux transporter metallochaperone ArsD [Anaeromicropila herbilytica]|uniref:Arsenical resistance operon transcriptional repressor ArsD n=1 Tax=Anaeromicropila herbilytica TaxID=2785025 RepID=A0A7R7ELZ7_9FIRM|nr:arsenite efflux transporter metallochaperone ArsD [Anaeromicropila herbilytica]BCN31025.1 arsenical resistance operon transcriptional repressor ArsD [Anaeromicropila herbilytica]